MFLSIFFLMLNSLLLLNKCDGLSWGKGPVGTMGHAENFFGKGVGILRVIKSFSAYISLFLPFFPPHS